MTLFNLLFGLVIAMGVFCAFLWSGLQTWRQRGGLRIAHGVAALLTLAIMAALGVEAFSLGRICAALLAPVALVALWLERGWNRAFPAMQLAFALALVFGWAL
ncbi:hypothetical protein [Oceanomicrobium pacificus]|uniref:Uncharacterized protein n=1 Tax=Oceanomicrobium pacificus TaxID=2692916 RepID=A0A6B0TWK7_9RHOB|nr:hypothetical protein [Oceanomicrobium pacificus]MXU65652.1 hypothetical protein [Oceanomicrobium pacificus]